MRMNVEIFVNFPKGKIEFSHILFNLIKLIDEISN